jgi:hypothetical protein
LKRFFLAILLTGTIAGTAQSSRPPGRMPDQLVGALSYGVFRCDFTALNGHMLEQGTTRGFNPYFTTLGFNGVIPVGGPKEQNATFDGGIILPQRLSTGDSTGFRMMGWYLLSSVWAYDLLRENTNLSLDMAPGMLWGGLYIKENDNLKPYRNPFIAPAVRMEFRVVLKPFAFGIRALYRYDVTSPRWKDSGGNSVLASSRLSGWGFQVFVGKGETGSWADEGDHRR